MLALIRKHEKAVVRLLLVSGLSTFVACATQKDPPVLVADPEHKAESTLPWNKQERWELAGGIPSQLGDSR
jgi:hypothetical protein